MRINDIARIAGVSVSTVSRVINKRSVAEEKRMKILQIMEQAGFIPDPYAQKLARKRGSKENNIKGGVKWEGLTSGG